MVSLTFIAMQSIPMVSQMPSCSAMRILVPTPSVARVMYRSPMSTRLAKRPDFLTIWPIPDLR